MRLLAIDPGPVESAWVIYDTEQRRLLRWGKHPNESPGSCVFDQINRAADSNLLAIEMVASYGMPVGAEVFETCVWIGRFYEHWLYQASVEPLLIYRREVKAHLCGSQQAKDSNVRQALLDRFGPGKEKAVGVKASPGPLYGLRSDGWAALGVAITAAETRLYAATGGTAT